MIVVAAMEADVAETKFFAGIGSRETPIKVLKMMGKLSTYLTELGYTLRSGHADGADMAFEQSAKSAHIFLPWKGFNYQLHKPLPDHKHFVISPSDKEAFKSVSKFHPKPSVLSPGAIKLMARNYRQIVGQNLPNSEFVICWTSDGGYTGGTAQAMKIADSLNIPVYNLFNEDVYDLILSKEIK